MVDRLPVVSPPRKRTSRATQKLGAKARATNPRPLQKMVPSRIGRRPMRSDSRPQNGSAKKLPMEKAVKIQVTCQAGAWKDWA